MSESILRHRGAHGTPNPNKLSQYTKNASHVDDLEHRIGELEDTLDALDKQIQIAEAESNSELVETLCKSYNDLNDVRIELSLKSLEFQTQMLRFEQEMSKSR